MAGKLALSDSTRTLTFRTVISILRSNPDLARVVQDWRVFDGSANDLAEVNTKRLPYVRISPVSLPTDFTSVNVSLCPVALKLEYVVEGSVLDDLLNLDDAVRVALFPGDGSVTTALQNIRTAAGTKVLQGPLPKLFVRQLVEFQVQEISGSRLLRGATVIAWREFVPTAS